MTIDACVAHAIHSDLDIIEALPGIAECPIKELEPRVEEYVQLVQEGLSLAIRSFCQPFLDQKDPAGLCSALLAYNLPIPLKTLRKMCGTIVELYTVKCEFIGHALDGKPIYEVKMNFQVGDCATLPT